MADRVQVFCSKQQPRCGACPLQEMCEYALHKGPRLVLPGEEEVAEVAAAAAAAAAARKSPAAAPESSIGTAGEPATEPSPGTAGRLDLAAAAAVVAGSAVIREDLEEGVKVHSMPPAT